MPQQQSLLDHAPTLETYLSRLDRELKPLPSEERDAARRELRGHVDALVAAHIELGMSEADATEAALRQFGDARRIGGNLRREYRLTARKGGAVALRYAVLWAVAAHLATWICTFVFGAIMEALIGNNVSPWFVTCVFGVVLGLFCGAGPALAGVIAETRAPAQGVRGVAYACVISTTFTVAVTAFVEASYQNPASWLSMLVVPMVWLPVGMTAACATRWTKRRKARLQSAR